MASSIRPNGQRSTARSHGSGSPCAPQPPRRGSRWRSRQLLSCSAPVRRVRGARRTSTPRGPPVRCLRPVVRPCGSCPRRYLTAFRRAAAVCSMHWRASALPIGRTRRSWSSQPPRPRQWRSPARSPERPGASPASAAAAHRWVRATAREQPTSRSNGQAMRRAPGQSSRPRPIRRERRTAPQAPRRPPGSPSRSSTTTGSARFLPATDARGG